jgi:hypothetical protein
VAIPVDSVHSDNKSAGEDSQETKPSSQLHLLFNRR